jgi:hypothetical protein
MTKVLHEARRIEEKISEKGTRVGPEKFYISLNGTAAGLMGSMGLNSVA